MSIPQNVGAAFAMKAACLSACVCLALATPMSVGCASGEVERVVVSGTITLDGVLLDQGAITLIPLDGGVSAGGEISGGSFYIDRRRGASPGRYRVEIVAYRATGELVDDPDLPGEKMEVTRQTVPARYNQQSELTAVVTGPGKNELVFTLSSSSS